MQTKKLTISSLILFLSVFVLPLAPISAATLVWNSSAGTVDGYNVYYSTSASSPGTQIDVGNTTQFNIDTLSLTENVQYYFFVTAYNIVGESAPCSPVAYTAADTTPPAPPTGLTAQ